MYGFIYMTTNLTNNKKYIGQKMYDKDGKWRNYLGSGIILNKAIQKYGKENFTRIILEYCKTKKELDIQESFWINHYNAVKSTDFYNIASGGNGGNTIAGYSKEKLEEYKKYKKELHKITSLKGENSPNSLLKETEVLDIINKLLNKEYPSDIAKLYSVSTGTISDIREHNTWCHLTSNIIFPDVKGRKRSVGKDVKQYNKNGSLIDTYSSAREAEERTGIGYKLISQVCNGKKRIAHGYIWRFKDDPFDLYDTQKTNDIKVDKYDLYGKYIKTYNSIKEANKSIKSGSVSSVIRGKCKSAGGFYWTKHNEKLIIPIYKRNKGVECYYPIELK